MIFFEVDQYNIEDIHKEIEDFFKRNQTDYNFFHPHLLSYNSLYEEVIEKKKDYFVFLMDDINPSERPICAYGLLRGWQEGYETPSLGIMVDQNYRGTGLSYLMMLHLHRVSEERGANKVRLTVLKENKSAISLYNKLGYTFSDKNKTEYIGIKTL